MGLKTFHEIFPEFRVALQISSARTEHVPPVDVTTSLELVFEEITDFIDREQFENVVEEMDELFLYHKSICAENPTANRKPPSPMEMRNK